MERLQNSGITEGLSFAFRQLSQGGGPKKIQERVKAEFQERYGSNLSDVELQQAARAELLQRMESQLEKEGVDVKGVSCKFVRFGIDMILTLCRCNKCHGGNVKEKQRAFCTPSLCVICCESI